MLVNAYRQRCSGTASGSISASARSPASVTSSSGITAYTMSTSRSSPSIAAGTMPRIDATCRPSTLTAFAGSSPHADSSAPPSRIAEI
jgi:hypothetical protein